MRPCVPISLLLPPALLQFLLLALPGGVTILTLCMYLNGSWGGESSARPPACGPLRFLAACPFGVAGSSPAASVLTPAPAPPPPCAGARTSCASTSDQACYPVEYFPPDEDCHTWPFTCTHRNPLYPKTFTMIELTLTALVALFIIINMCIYIALLLLARRQLQRRPYAEFRIAHLEMGMQVGRVLCIGWLVGVCI